MDRYTFLEKSTDEELVAIVEGGEHPKEIIEKAKALIRSRLLIPSSLKAHARMYFERFFKNQLERTILVFSVPANLPDSFYLSEEELKELFEEVFNEVRSRRTEFYKNLPDG